MELMNPDSILFNEISALIEQSRHVIYAQANSATVTLFWKIGKRINVEVLQNKRAEYGKQIVSRLATQLTQRYGQSFEARNLRRMMQFAEQFSDFEIVSLSATHLSWAHIVEILPLKTNEAKLFYLSEASRGLVGRDKLREMISRKAYERREIANTQITTSRRESQSTAISDKRIDLF